MSALDAPGWPPPRPPRPDLTRFLRPSDAADTLRAALKAGGSPNVVDERGRTPLMISAKKGFRECAAVLVASGADVAAANTAGATALHIACQHAREAMCLLLIEAGASVSVADAVGATPLDRLRDRSTAGLSPFSMEAIMANCRRELATRLASYAAGAMPSALAPTEEIRAAAPTHFPDGTPTPITTLPPCYHQRPWCPAAHRFFPREFRQMVLMLLCHAQRGEPTVPSATLPVEMWVQVLIHTHRDWLLEGR